MMVLLSNTAHVWVYKGEIDEVCQVEAEAPHKRQIKPLSDVRLSIRGHALGTLSERLHGIEG